MSNIFTPTLAGDLVRELDYAEQIILVMLRHMSLEQKSAVGSMLARKDIPGEGMTRYHERRDVLVRAREVILRDAAAAPIRCTCPTGDGSLGWPCAAHPPTQQPTLVEAYLAMLPEIHQRIDFSNCRPGRPLSGSATASTQPQASPAPSSPSDRTGG